MVCALVCRLLYCRLLYCRLLYCRLFFCRFLDVPICAALLAAPAAAGTLTLELATPKVSGTQVIDIETPEGESSRGYLLNLSGGEIRVIERNNGGIQPVSFLDGIEGARNAYAMAFAPDYASSGKVYVTYSTDDNHVVLAEYTRDGTNADRLDPASHRVVMDITHNSGTHHGADIGFGPDGMLYMTTGDSDAPFDGLNVAQDTSDLRGAVLRFDPTGDDYPDDPNRNYTLPGNNPDFGTGADPALWAIGLRNPFKASWDPITGRYFIADVGEDGWEEINLGTAGGNFGWSAFEGDGSFDGTLGAAGELQDPLYAYGHSNDPLGGYSVTGGEVYRGEIEALDGAYLFGEFGGVTSETLGSIGRIFSFDADSTPEAIANGTAGLTQWDIDLPLGQSLDRILGFGMDGTGTFYVSDYDGDLFAITGATIAPVPLPAGVLLSGTGLGALLIMRRRKRPVKRA